MKGYLDRIEENQYAVILVEAVNKEFIIHKEKLPAGSSVHSWFDVTLEDGHITGLTLNEEATASSEQKVDNLTQKLRNKSRSKFKKN
ncbi:DUF3006 domain-containing protein [Bacillus canaveralius]|uniref:DUF3006 domain-containing protein n=1 Tax=Bacillus canaveralius TaxID=1403243 RepID=A0A2N5GGC3_9BACI|nr:MULTISPECIES: DUF3006 domain-containing protein [Bacillus]PLR79750.1 DUF3006 domain-containing protein [Bacillus canaveralius]PLR81705.1 DUF3006 domain-containing protein [Bacillus sp. V33-4]PLR93160.1 DUF3006 domain-containing protein [Bacillus canaveralius]RSK52696.1 DUF3006 domain-containing protein [Bacillus canaveralius]